jgi:hypothetical protein
MEQMQAARKELDDRDRNDAVAREEVERNLTAHGILSAIVAIRLNMPTLCSNLTNMIAEIANYTMEHKLSNISKKGNSNTL